MTLIILEPEDQGPRGARDLMTS